MAGINTLQIIKTIPEFDRRTLLNGLGILMIYFICLGLS